MEKLAINGGFSVRQSKIFYGRQWIDEDDIQAVADILSAKRVLKEPPSR